MKFKYFKSDGADSGEKDVDNFPSLEDGKGIDALRQCVIAVHANQRQGNASTKVRSEVRGSGKKIYRQKGLGVGRAGDKKAIQRRGGGVIFGPRPRSYTQKLNKKIKLLALKRALIDQATSDNILLIEDWKVSESKTKLVQSLINKIVPNGKKVLAVDESFDHQFTLAARNLSVAKLGRAQDLSPLDVVQSDQIILSLKGLDVLISKLSNEGSN
jgi:large subunit ribosomal protein L4